MSNHVYDLCTNIFGSAVYRKAVRFLIFAGGLRYLPYRTATFLNPKHVLNTLDGISVVQHVR